MFSIEVVINYLNVNDYHLQSSFPQNPKTVTYVAAVVKNSVANHL